MSRSRRRILGRQSIRCGRNVVVRTTINSSAYSVVSEPKIKTYGTGDVMLQRLVYDTRNELAETDYAIDQTQSEGNPPNFSLHNEGSSSIA